MLKEASACDDKSHKLKPHKSSPIMNEFHDVNFVVSFACVCVY